VLQTSIKFGADIDAVDEALHKMMFAVDTCRWCTRKIGPIRTCKQIRGQMIYFLLPLKSG